MSMQVLCKVIAVFLVIALLCNGSSSQYYNTPHNPCSNIFAYQHDGYNPIGILTLRDVAYGTTTVQIEMTQPGVLNQDYSGKLSLIIDKDRVFDYIRTGTPITYRVDFPLQNIIPRVTEILVNNVRICQGPKDPPPRATVNLEHTLRTYSSLSAPRQQSEQQQPQQFPEFSVSPQQTLNIRRNPSAQPIYTNGFENGNRRSTFNQPPSTEAPLNEFNPFVNTILNNGFVIPNEFGPRNPQPTTPTTTTTTVRPAIAIGPSTPSYIESICGQENSDVAIHKLAVNGQFIDRSRFPWIVAIYTRNITTLTFQCGGSLISARTVISAAHCFQQGLEGLRPEHLLLSLGRHNLNDWHNAVNMDVEQLVRHPDYRPEVDNFDADVAIVQLKGSVTFSTAIRPICLWQGSTDTRVIEGKKGVIVGWGEDESHTGVVSLPKLVNATIVSELTCIRSNQKFYYLTSNRTLCAGNRDGSGPCMGDSGSGLMVQNRNKWMLRGTVSASLSSPANQCNLEEYVVYSDIAMFLDWIKSNMLL